MKEISYYENTQNKTHTAYINIQCNCALCSAPLEVKCELLSDQQIKEIAFCPECEIRARVKIYILH